MSNSAVGSVGQMDVDIDPPRPRSTLNRAPGQDKPSSATAAKKSVSLSSTTSAATTTAAPPSSTPSSTANTTTTTTSNATAAEGCGKAKGKTVLARLLHPQAKKLATPEAERVFAVVDLACRRSQMLPFLMSAESAECQAVLAKLSPDYATAMGEHKDIVARYEAAVAEGDSFTSAKLAVDLKSSTRILLRAVTNNPRAQTLVLDHMQQQQQQQSGSSSTLSGVFVDSMKELRTILFERLLTTAEEETQRLDYLKSLIAKSARTDGDRTKLESEYEKLAAHREDLLESRAATIAKLQAQLESLQRTSDETTIKLEYETVCKENAEEESLARVTESLQARIKALGQELENCQRRHKDSELNLRRRKFKIESELENWIGKYDAEMSEKQSEIDSINAQYQEERAQLSELQRRFTEMEAEYNFIMEERRIEREARQAAENEMQLKIRAALLLQSLWRSYRCRKALRKAQQKSKGKGKKEKA